MQVLGMSWLGTRTAAFDDTVRFFRDLLGLRIIAEPDGFTVFAVPDGSTVEVFGPQSRFNSHLTAPVAGFEVTDLAAAEQELREAGTEIVLPLTGGDERRWLHFRAPDGHVYELMEQRATATGIG
jgi:catechol 2,3-dioxygenase-like lactoylglutathione lyase family enzyme